MSVQVPIGSTVAFCGATEPAGWKWANGQSVDLTGGLYGRLAIALATIGITPPNGTLPLPDLRGRAPVAPVAPGPLPTFTTVGAATAVAGVPAHSHTAAGGTLAPAVPYGLDVIDTDPVYGLKFSPSAIAVSETYVTGGSTRLYGGLTVGNGVLADAGGSGAHSNLSPYILLNFIIKVTGQGVQGYPVGSLLPFAGAAARVASFSTSGGQLYANTTEPHGFAVGDRVHVQAPGSTVVGEWVVGPDVSASSLGLLGSSPGAATGYSGSGYVSPAGWVVTDQDPAASTYNGSVDMYAPLYGVIGTTFGGSATSYRTPDTRGRIVTGRDNMNRGSSAGLMGSDTVGAAGGAYSHPLTEAEITAHRHSSGTLAASIWFGEVPGYGVYPPGLESVGYQGHTMVVAEPTAGVLVSGLTGPNSGGGSAHNNMPSFVAVPHLLKY